MISNPIIEEQNKSMNMGISKVPEKKNLKKERSYEIEYNTDDQFNYPSTTRLNAEDLFKTIGGLKYLLNKSESKIKLMSESFNFGFELSKIIAPSISSPQIPSKSNVHFSE